jgi:hypothetical protein
MARAGEEPIQWTAIQLTPPGLNFGNQQVGTTSLAQTITLSNKSHVEVGITSISITGVNAGDFSRTLTSGKSVASGAKCFIYVKFKPTATGTRTAAISVSDNGAGSPQKVSLAGALLEEARLLRPGEESDSPPGPLSPTAPHANLRSGPSCQH